MSPTSALSQETKRNQEPENMLFSVLLMMCWYMTHFFMCHTHYYSIMKDARHIYQKYILLIFTQTHSVTFVALYYHWMHVLHVFSEQFFMSLMLFQVVRFYGKAKNCCTMRVNDESLLFKIVHSSLLLHLKISA